ncbi:MAG: response regulator [Pseudomonadota bacterium]
MGSWTKPLQQANQDNHNNMSEAASTARRRPVRSKKPKPSVLFVDDEQRVLNSMRALFRRDYDVYLTTRGSEAVQWLKEKNIDVIVADQRMPEMTGVEVLGAGKEVSPRTVRILLTGYADLDAIEGSINVGEVFRFLSKPCPPNHLRDTLKLAVDIARNSAADANPEPEPKPVPAPPADKPLVMQPEPAPTPVAANDAPAPDADAGGEEIVLAAANDEPVSEPDEPTYDTSSTSESVALPVTMPADTGEEIILEAEFDGGSTVAGGLESSIGAVGVVVFSSSEAFASSATGMLSADHPVHWAKTLVQVTEILSEGKAGVLVTDFVSEGRVLRKMIATLKRYLPELITIVISDDRDASEMISLINHGQVFRYMSKPAQRDRFAQNVNAAVLKHLQLRENPELVKRYQVEDDRSAPVPQILMQFLGRIKTVRRLLVRERY